MHITSSSKSRNLPFYLGYLTDELVQQAKQELGETEEVRRKAILELRKLIKDEKELVCRDDDEYLLQFLRARKFNVKRSLKTIVSFYEIKKQLKWLSTADFAGIQKAFREEMVSILPYRDEDGCPIFVFQLDKWNLQEKKITSILHYIAVGIMLCVEDPATQVTGIKIIFDVRSLSVNHVTHVHPKYLYFIAKGVKDCLPIRLKAVYVMTETTVFYYFWNIIKVLLTSKIRNRIHLHSAKNGSLMKYLHPDLIPVEYGGNHRIDNEKLLEYIATLEDVYLEKISLGYKMEPKRKNSTDEVEATKNSNQCSTRNK